jgi:hypothetical protein
MTAATIRHASTSASHARRTSRTVWAGRAISTLIVLLLLFDATGKLLRVPQVVEGTAQLGYPASTIVPIGIILLTCVVLYAIPRTAVFGAVLLTGYLGGAIASNVRVGNPLFTHELFPIYVAVFIWGGLYLRDPRVRGLVAGR